MPSLEKRAEDLRRQIDHHNYLYYQQAKPEITDREFDRLLEELTQLEADHPELVTPDSPTQRVGGRRGDALIPARHRQRMYSIETSYNPDMLREWDKSIRKLLGK